jgi:hypothetical protein
MNLEGLAKGAKIKGLNLQKKIKGIGKCIIYVNEYENRRKLKKWTGKMA